MPRLPALLLPLLLLGCSPMLSRIGIHPSSRAIVLVGDSTTWGTPPAATGTQSPHDPGRSLEALLAIDPGPWRNADVLNYGVGASNTQHWLAAPPAGCGTLLAGFPVVEIACRDNVSWIEVVSRKSPDLVVVDLGLNDALVTTDPEETVDRLVQIRDALSPVPVAFFPPIAPPNGPRGAWPWHVREAMERRGLFAGEYPAWLPTFDRLHPTDGGYAAKAGLWLDAIHQQP